MSTRNLLSLSLLLGFFCMRLVYSDTESACSSCYKNLSDSDKATVKATQSKIVSLKDPKLPTSLAVASLMQGKEPPFDIGCVALRFRITEAGKAEDIEVLESVPEKVFVRSATRALQDSEFSKEAGIGIQVFNYRIEK